MLTETITVGDLVARTSDILHRHTGRPEVRTLGGAVLIGTAMSIVDPTGIAGGSILEAATGYELYRVRSVSGFTLTVERGFANTPQITDPYGGPVLKDPVWPKATILRGVSDALANMHSQVPLLKSQEFTVPSGDYYINLTGVTDLWVPKRVGMFYSGHWAPLPDWEFVDDVTSTDEAGVTRFLTLPYGLTAGEKVIVTYKAKYAAISYTTPPADNTTITLPLGARDLPALCAAGRLLSNREVTRAEIDRVEEAAQSENVRTGWTIRAVNQLWQEYYRRVDEVVRSIKETEPRHRPYRKMTAGRLRRAV